MYDNLAGNVVFEATSIWSGCGELRVPRFQPGQEIEDLHRQQNQLRESLSRVVQIRCSKPIADLEATLYQQNFRIESLYCGFKLGGDDVALLLIPPDATREEAIEILQRLQYVRITS